MFCQKCGAKNPDDSSFCNSCGAALVLPIAQPSQSGKHNEVIRAKIATKKEQIAGISQTGPVILCLLGFPALLFYVFPGLIFIGVSVWWSSSRENDKTKLQNEIKELEAELV